MGSDFVIVNNTEFDVWVTTGVNWTVLVSTVVITSAVLTAGASVASLAAGAGAGGALAGGGALIMAEEGIIMGVTASTYLGLSAGAWTGVGIVTGVSSAVVSTMLNITEAEARALQKKVREFKAEAQLIKPGGRFTYPGTLSLTMTAYVMNDAL